MTIAEHGNALPDGALELMQITFQKVHALRVMHLAVRHDKVATDKSILRNDNG